jgi:hypothetical protein
MFHPFALAAVRVYETTGGVLSILIVIDTDCDKPAPLTAVQVTIVPVVSALRVIAEHPVVDAIPDSASLTVQLTVTSLRNQLLMPEGPVAVGETIGGVVSDGVGATTLRL